jgi:dipeptidase E
MNDPRIVQAILNMIDNNKSPSDVQVLYLGTATYDIDGFYKRQTQRFVDAGCQVQPLKVAGLMDEQDQFSSDEQRLQHYIDLIDDADVLVVGGGNTQFALDRWNKLGLVPALRRAAKRGAVLTGGSAGAICWFDGGHSNSADPATYKKIRVKRFAHRSPEEIVDEIYAYKPLDGESETEDESDSDDDEDMTSSSDSDYPMSDSEDESSEKKKKPWEYYRVSALGFLPGLVSPHLDRVQSNGVLRAYDFDECLKRHTGEVGIGIDHFAALIVDGPNFRVLSLEDKEGTNKNGTFVEDGSGIPGIWIKRATENGEIVSTICPTEGQLKDILSVATSIVEDFEETHKCRKANPDDGWVPAVLPPSIRQ